MTVSSANETNKKTGTGMTRFSRLLPRTRVHIGDYIRSFYLRRELARLPTNTFYTVLDAGCGDGHHVFDIARTFPHLHVTGIDIIVTDAMTNRPSQCNTQFLREDLRSLKEHNTYDFIYSIDVIEHIPDNRRVLLNIFNALKPGAYLYLHLPNKAQRENIFPRRLLSDFHAWEEKEHIGELYTLDGIKLALQGIGFEISKTEYTFGIIGQFSWELDRITDRSIAIKTIIMPFLKALGQLSVRIKTGNGNILLIARKPGEASPP